MSDKNCGHKVPCGCNDNSITTPPPCDEGIDCKGTDCAETFCAECIQYCGETVSYGTGDSEITISQGESYDIVMQKLLLYTVDATCATTVVVGIELKDSTSSSLTFTWLDNDGALVLTLTDGTTTFVENKTGLLEYTFINLTPDTEYTFSIASGPTFSCQSLKLKTKTKELL